MLQRLLRQAASRPPGAAALAAAWGSLQEPALAPGPSFHYFHGAATAHQSNLGVVSQLRDETAIALPASGRRSFWEVVELRADGSALETWKTPEVLCLHPRDVHLFTSETGFSQRAYIAPRSAAILFRTPVCKAIIYSDRMVLFPTKRLPDTVRVAQAVKSAISQRSGLPFELRVLEALLAEVTRALEGKCKRLGVVAESVVSEINANFHSSAGELQRLLPIQRKLNEVERDVQEVAEAVGEAADDDNTLRKLALTERAALISSGAHPGVGSSFEAPYPLHHSSAPSSRPQQAAEDARGKEEHHDGGEEEEEAGSRRRSAPAQQNLDQLAPQPTQKLPNRGPVRAVGPVSLLRSPHMRMAAQILESYEAKLQGANAALRELLETIDQTRTVWHMQLDHQRNRILRVNLLLSIMGFGGLTASLIPSYFGMNVMSGLEAADDVFMPIVGGSITFGVIAASGMYAYYKIGPKRRYQARLRDMRALRDLLSFHVDDLESIVDCIKAKGGVGQNEFKDIVRSSIKSSRPPSQEEIGLLWRVFDTNRDGFLELSELVRLEEHIQGESTDLSHHMT